MFQRHEVLRADDEQPGERRDKTSMIAFAHPWSWNGRRSGGVLPFIPGPESCILGIVIEEDHVAGMVEKPRG